MDCRCIIMETGEYCAVEPQCEKDTPQTSLTLSQSKSFVEPPVIKSKGTKLKQGQLLFLPVGTKSSSSSPPKSNAPEKCTSFTLRSDELTSVPISSPSASTGGKVGGVTSPKQSLMSNAPAKLSKKEQESLRAEKERIKAEAKAKKDEEHMKRELEKQLREQEKKEKQIKKEQEMKERREKKEREELEKKERKERREAEKQKKEEERKKKEEERKKKLEEKRQLEEHKEQLKEEKLHRENQAKSKFRKYFGKAEKMAVKKDDVSNETILTPFSIKDGMDLAKPPCAPLHNTVEFDQQLKHQNSDYKSNYVQTCKSLKRKTSRKIQNEKLVTQKDDSMIIIPSDSVSNAPKQKLPAYKLLQFTENHRPAYYGTWRKRRGFINPRNPFKKDKGLLDYEVDSDEEWVEEEPGESISSSEGEDKDKDGERDGEDSDEDDGFFVPHGYLSNDEGDCSDSGEFIPGPEEDPQDAKRKRQLAKAWEAEFVRKCQPMEPKVIGCLWISISSPEKILPKEEAFLMQFAAVALSALPIPVPVASKGESSTERSETQGLRSAESTKQPVPEEAMPDLIRLIHKNSMGMAKIINTFRAHWGATKTSANSPHEAALSQPPNLTPNLLPNRIDSTPKSTRNPLQHQEYENASGISKRQLEKKIQSIAIKGVRSSIPKSVWYVHDAVLKQYGFDQENFTPLVPDSSPILRAPLPGHHLTPSPDTVSKKRKSNGAGKSLLQFLSRSPLDKAPGAKRLKIDSTISSESKGEVIILDSPADDAKPLTKRPCLEQIPSHKALSNKPTVSSNSGDTATSTSLQTDSSVIHSGGSKEIITI